MEILGVDLVDLCVCVCVTINHNIVVVFGEINRFNLVFTIVRVFLLLV